MPEAYTLNAFRVCTDGSRRNLGVETLDLVQLHSAYGVSVETVSEALRAIAPDPASPPCRSS